MNKIGKALGITAVITGIAGIAAGTVAVVKKVKANKETETHKCKCKDKENHNETCGKSFEEHLEDMKVHEDCNCDCGDDCTCTVLCDEGCKCEESILEEETVDNAECLKGKEDCEDCNFKEGCKLK